ncbi:MAG TPA: TylF/MycF/NovP-related O-methyltransferase [Rhizobacter sp.]
MLEGLKRVAGRIVGRSGLPRDLSAEDRLLLTRIRADRLTYLSDRKLVSLLNTVRGIENAGLPGVFIEAGCALGGSAILIATTKQTERPFEVYDVFGMIPAPTAEDTPDVHQRYRAIVQGESEGIAGDPYYGYRDDLYDLVQANLYRYGIDLQRDEVSLIKGLVQDTLRPNAAVAFAHVDVDWYEPVMTCLERIFPQLVVGGSIILDDYHDWGGCRKATDEFLRGVTGTFMLDDRAGSLRITKVDQRH